MTSALSYVLDLGSHSVKVYRRPGPAGPAALLVDTVTWELLERRPGRAQLGRHLDDVLARIPGPRRTVTAIGTAAVRRDPGLAEELHAVCSERGISYRTISQDDEARLIRLAAAEAGIPAGLHVVNAGGGSIQIVTGSRGVAHLLPFGISDLNRRFDLGAPPGARRAGECVEWVAGRLPALAGEFAYTGGEHTYLEHFGVELPDGRCSAAAFAGLADRLRLLPGGELEALSPFDPKWMHGAVASNCIVTACLARWGCDRFLPVDLNIAHGLIRQV
jgi:hypothetical protein